MTVQVLYDPRRADAELLYELARQGLHDSFHIWNPVYDLNAARSISLSHKQIVTSAKLAKVPEVCIFEEDIQFPSKDGWEYFLKHKPTDYDLYLGGIYGLDEESKSKLRQTGETTIQVKIFSGLHCYFIHEKFYDKFLSVPDGTHIDSAMADLGNFWVVYPFAAIQRPGWSANNRQDVNYNTSLNKKDIYDPAS